MHRGVCGSSVLARSSPGKGQPAQETSHFPPPFVLPGWCKAGKQILNQTESLPFPDIEELQKPIVSHACWKVRKKSVYFGRVLSKMTFYSVQIIQFSALTAFCKCINIFKAYFLIKMGWNRFWFLVLDWFRVHKHVSFATQIKHWRLNTNILIQTVLPVRFSTKHYIWQSVELLQTSMQSIKIKVCPWHLSFPPV